MPRGSGRRRARLPPPASRIHPPPPPALLLLPPSLPPRLAGASLGEAGGKPLAGPEGHRARREGPSRSALPARPQVPHPPAPLLRPPPPPVPLLPPSVEASWGCRRGGTDGPGRVPAVWDVLRALPQYGLGQRVHRTTWGETCYWTVTNVKAKPHGGGKVWGRLTWDGVEKEAPEQIPGRVKQVWTAREKEASGWKPAAAFDEALTKSG